MENNTKILNEVLITNKIKENVKKSNGIFKELHSSLEEISDDEFIKSYNKIVVDFGFEIFNLIISNYASLIEICKQKEMSTPFMFVASVVDSSDEGFSIMIDQAINSNQDIAYVLNYLMKETDASKSLDMCCKVFELLTEMYENNHKE